MRTRCATVLRAATLLFGLTAGTAAAEPTGTDVDVRAVVADVDENQAVSSRTSTVTLTVAGQGRRAEYKLRMVERGPDVAVEFLAPARDKGTKVVRIDGAVWRYEPRTERAEPLNGTALREPMMGSALSWADLTTPLRFGRYTPRLVRQEALEGRPVWVVELTGADAEPYTKRLVWIDPATSLPVRQELYGSSGILMKTWTMTEPKAVGDHWVPMQMEVSDAVTQGRTTLKRTDVQIGGPIEEALFQPAWLKQAP
jgi:hypothetical protein